MVVIGHLMRVALIGVHYIHDVFMGVAVILARSLDWLCAFADMTIPTAKAIVNAKRRNDIACRFICPFPQVSARLLYPPRGDNRYL